MTMYVCRDHWVDSVKGVALSDHTLVPSPGRLPCAVCGCRVESDGHVVPEPVAEILCDYYGAR